MKKRPITIDGDVAYVPLTRGQTTVIDAEDAERVGQYNWQAYWDKHALRYYARAWINSKMTRLHRFLLDSPESQVDHIDGDSLNNRKSNLREATNKENGENRLGAARDSVTGIRGVSPLNFTQDGRTYSYYRACVGHGGEQLDATFPQTPEGLEAATQWVTEKRAELFTHSDGR